MTDNKFINGLAVNDYGGDKTPLIFLHAFPLTSRMWDNQVAHFIEKYRVITYDIRGLGNSSEDENYFFTMESYCDDLLTILDSLQIEKAHMCGLSMGGYILLRSYEKSPERFLSITLADTRAERDDNAGLINRSNLIKSIAENGLDNLSKDFPSKLVSEKTGNEIRQLLSDTIISQNPNGVIGSVYALATRTDSSDLLKSISVPTLIIVGEDDNLTPIEFSTHMHREISDSRLLILSGAGHLSAIEQPEKFNAGLEDFLSGIS